MENNNKNYIERSNGEKVQIEITGVNISESGPYYNYILREISWKWRNIETGETGNETKYSFEWGWDFGAVYGDDEESVWASLELDDDINGEEYDWDYDNLGDVEKMLYDETYEEIMEVKLQSMIDYYNEDNKTMPETLVELIDEAMTETEKYRK